MSYTYYKGFRQHVTFKLTKGYRQSCHSLAHIWFPICLPV